jgi:IS5 family transposase
VLREGSVVNATITSAPSSPKSRTGKRDGIAGLPEMQQARKGNEWYFGMKMHIGADDTLGLIHSIDTTADYVLDMVPAGNLLHGDEQHMFGNAGYLGIQKRADQNHRKHVDCGSSTSASINGKR